MIVFAIRLVRMQEVTFEIEDDFAAFRLWQFEGKRLMVTFKIEVLDEQEAEIYKGKGDV